MTIDGFNPVLANIGFIVKGLIVLISEFNQVLFNPRLNPIDNNEGLSNKFCFDSLKFFFVHFHKLEYFLQNDHLVVYKEVILLQGTEIASILSVGACKYLITILGAIIIFVNGLYIVTV